jgi:hypothetical protein
VELLVHTCVHIKLEVLTVDLLISQIVGSRSDLSLRRPPSPSKGPNDNKEESDEDDEKSISDSGKKQEDLPASAMSGCEDDAREIGNRKDQIKREIGCLGARKGWKARCLETCM